MPLAFLFSLLVPAPAASQAPPTSFGRCVDYSLGFVPRSLAARRQGSDPRRRIAVLAAERPLIGLFSLVKSGGIVADGTCDLHSLQQQIVAVESGIEAGPEFVTLSADGGSVSILRRRGGSYEERVIPIEGNPQRIVVADINNDGKSDLLLFGRSVAGVITLLGAPGGDFVPGPVLFPEISVSDLCTADLNGDGITDVLLLNWLSNQLVVFYGISRAIFSEQLTVDLPAEPGQLAVSGPVRRAFRVAVTLPGAQEIAVLTGNSAGEFTMDGTIPCAGKPEGVLFSDVNGDRIPDIVSSTDRGVLVALASSKEDFASPVMFGLCTGNAPWAVADVDDSGRPDLLVGDPSTRRLVIAANASRSGAGAWPEQFAVGSFPEGLCVADFDGDGRNDVAVVNNRSATISFLLNKGNGDLGGQQAVGIPDSPVSVIAIQSGRGRSASLVTSHPSADKIGVVALTEEIGESESFSIPTGPGPHVLLASGDTSGRSLDILVRYRNAHDGSVSLSLFEKIGGGQYLERSLKAHLPNRITALSVGDYAGSGMNDLLFVTNDPSTRQSTVALSRGGPAFSFGAVSNLFTYTDSLSSTKGILPADLDGDRFGDFLLVVGPPRRALALAYGRGNGVFGDSLQWVEDVQPLNDDAVVVSDVDGDGHNDLVVLDELREAVVVLYGLGRREFLPPQTVISAKGVSAIAVASLRRPGTQDLILSHQDTGMISVVFAPFERRSGR